MSLSADLIITPNLGLFQGTTENIKVGLQESGELEPKQNKASQTKVGQNNQQEWN